MARRNKAGGPRYETWYIKGEAFDGAKSGEKTLFVRIRLPRNERVQIGQNLMLQTENSKGVRTCLVSVVAIRPYTNLIEVVQKEDLKRIGHGGLRSTLTYLWRTFRESDEAMGILVFEINRVLPWE